MSKQLIQRIDNKDIKGSLLKYLIEYRNSLLLYGNSDVLFHDEEGYDLINKSDCSKGRKSFRGSQFSIQQRSIISDKKSVNQILRFNEQYFMMKDNHPHSLLAIRDDNDAFVIREELVATEVKKRYMSREELENYLSSSGQLIRYNNTWTNSIKIPSNEEILSRFKEYVIRNYVDNQNDDEFKRIMVPVINNTGIESVARDFMVLTEEVLLIKEKDLAVSYVNIKFAGLDWFKVETKTLPPTKYNLSQVKEITNNKVKEKKIFDLNPMLNKRFIKDI